MVGLGMLALDLLGASTAASGLACTPTAPTSLNVQIGPGRLYSLQNVDGTAYSSLAADTTHQILKQGILADAATLGCTAPTTFGFSVNYLIQAAYQDSDTNLTTLPYYNVANPTQPFSGPGNLGTAQATTRAGTVLVQVKPGIAATSGTQTTPAPDAGFIGLYVVTVANGAASIVAGNIAKYPNAPFLQSPGPVAAEIALGITPVNFFYPAGHVYRYGANAVPGTTDMTAAITAALSVGRQGGYTVQIPIFETQLVSSSLNVTNCRVAGLGNPWVGPGIKATSAQFDILTLTQAGGFAFLVLENLCVDGGNPGGATAGLLGDTVSLKKTSPAHPYLVSITNCAFNNNKQRGIYIERGGYTSLNHLHVLGNGLHAIECSGTTTDACTTIRDFGSSQYGSCPQGYGIKLTNCISCVFKDSIVEDTWGIQLNGTVNRALVFDGVYQEGFTVTNPTGMYITDNAGGAGLTIDSAIGFNVGGAPLQTPAFTLWTGVYYRGNSGLAQGPIPLAGRISTNTAGPATVAATGDVTVGQLALTSGTWRLSGRVQTILSTGAGTITQLACTLTTNASASGLSNLTSSFVEGADQTQSFGVNQDGSVKCSTIIQIAPGVTTTYYLRAHITLSGTITEGYNGILRAELIE